MAKIKLTKNELKRQKDQLKRFQRYLPTLVLKKQLLQTEVRNVERQIEDKRLQRQEAFEELLEWVDVFGENIAIAHLVQVKEVCTSSTNIAGVDLPILMEVKFEAVAYDLLAYPFWVDAAVKKLQELATLDMVLSFLEKQAALLAAELRVTAQRVNLFEKVKIPETKENIRMINIFLGDQQTAAVVRGKMAKNKLVRGTI
ncbi:MAG TPA: V-type ATP synthase subunit D [Bacillota bacterium]|nr:V-type ATP synthase subunit D [Bacillota bacterium]